MTRDKERAEWKIGGESIDRYVELVIDRMEEKTDIAAIMAVDMPFRNFLHWIHSAQSKGKSADATRQQIIHLIGLMVIETASRMVDINRSFDARMALTIWTRELIGELAEDLMEDIKELAERIQAQ